MRARAERNGYKNGTKFNGLASQVVYRLLPTPTMFDYNTPRSAEAWERAKEKHGDALQVPLKQLAANGMLPTPIAGDWKGQRRADGTASMLSGKASLGMLPTPTATSDPKGGCTRPDPTRQRDTLAHAMHDPTHGKTSQLNPRFVAEMMGFPVNWTELPFQSGEPSQSKPTETP
jgi:hypothetical protein